MKAPFPARSTLGLLAAGLLAAAVARAEADPTEKGPAREPLSAAQLKQGKESLSDAAEDPTAALWKLQINSSEITNYYALNDATANTTAFKLSIPYKWDDQSHLFQVSAPFITRSPQLDTGLSDMTAFDLWIFNRKWGRWGFGPVALFPTGGKTRGTEQYAIGPVIGIIWKEGKLLYGVLNQNLFSYAGNSSRRPVRFSGVQPILNYGLGNGWSVGSSDMLLTYNYVAGRWTNLPVGVRLSKVTRIVRRPTQISLEYEWNLTNEKGDPKSQARLNFTLFQRNPFAD